MPDIFDAADRLRAQVLAEESQATSAMLDAYARMWPRLSGRIDALVAKVAKARAEGTRISPAWLFQEERLQALQRELAAEITRFTRTAEREVILAQNGVIELAQEHAEELAKLPLGTHALAISWAQLPKKALSDLAGFLSDGSPLRVLLDGFGPQASLAARNALLTGITLGENPLVIARELRQALGIPLVRAITIARTEVLRSYRESSRRSYVANSDVVAGWIWHAQLGPRTCSSCWAMSGSFHTLDERLDDHPRGRCVAIPVSRSWAELGFPGIAQPSVQKREQGADVFAHLPKTQQEAILGPGKYALYRDGEIELEDLIQRDFSTRWGTTRREASISQALAHAAQRE
jgi:hypothetical protein